MKKEGPITRFLIKNKLASSVIEANSIMLSVMLFNIMVTALLLINNPIAIAFSN
jgi:hypothetical protein